MSDRYAELASLEQDFLAAFNAADVDRIMAFFTEDAVYGEVHGKERGNLEAIRKSFDKLFSGQFGEVKFEPSDTFIDIKNDAVMSGWHLHLSLDGQRVALEGLDLLYFRGDKIYKKLTYGKAQAPLYVGA
ncbi:MAG: nuclear transport factor 2 family protein [Pseudomonadota bacterium]